MVLLVLVFHFNSIIGIVSSFILHLILISSGFSVDEFVNAGFSYTPKYQLQPSIVCEFETTFCSNIHLSSNRVHLAQAGISIGVSFFSNIYFNKFISNGMHIS